MIEYESVEFKTLQKMNEIEAKLEKLNSKMNHVDLGVSVNNLFLAAEFEIERHPKAIINRDTLEGYYFSEAKKEIQKMIRTKDQENRIKQSKHDDRKFTDSRKKFQLNDDDDWLNV